MIGSAGRVYFQLTVGYKVAIDGEGHAISVFEVIWETQQDRYGGCGSAFIREDIVSNHIGAKARERDDADGSIMISAGMHAEDIIEEYLGSIVSESTARAALVSSGYISP